MYVQPLHFAGDMHHFVQRWRDQPAEADDVNRLFRRYPQNFLAGHHYPQVDDLVVVTLQHHTHNILADIVYIPLYRGQQNFAVGSGSRHFSLFNPGLQVGYRLLHDTCAFHHLR